MRQANKKKTKQLVFNILTTGAVLLTFLTVVFRILPPVFLFVATVLWIAVVILAINILLEGYRNR